MNHEGEGREKLWGWFGLSYAAFLTIPRVLMHAMSDEWQGKMAELLKEYDEVFPNQPDISIRCQAVSGKRLVKFPGWVLNYRHPDKEAIEEIKKTPA
jgi:hypothetical protein